MDLPNNLECEKGLLCSVLHDPSIAKRINAQVFYSPSSTIVIGIVGSLLSSNTGVDYNTILGLASERDVSEIGGKEYLSSLFDYVPIADNWEHYYNILLELYDKRKFIIHAREIERLAKEKDSRIEEIEAVAAKIRKSGGGIKVVTPMDMTLEFNQWMEDVYDEKIKERKIEWGFGISKLIESLVPGDLCLIGGKPGSGKTSIANCVVSYSCISQMIHCLIFSMEMKTRQVMERISSIMSRVPLKRIRNPRILSERDWGALRKSLASISNSKLGIIDEALSIHEIFSAAREAKPELVIVDHAQLLKLPDGKKEKRENLDEAGVTCKWMAKELDCVVMLLTQINRDDNSPFECSSLEAHADQFIIVPQSASNEVEKKLFVRKNRNGPIGFVDVNWSGECAAFY